MFVTSTRHTGDFGGLAAGDAICNDLAANSTIASVAAGTYVAWLSVFTPVQTDAFNRITDPSGGFIRTDGRLIATSRVDLLDGSLDRPIELDENGNAASAPFAWTGTSSQGIVRSNTCASWTTDAANELGLAGATRDTDDDWTEASNDGCDREFHLYCVEI